MWLGVGRGRGEAGLVSDGVVVAGRQGAAIGFGWCTGWVWCVVCAVCVCCMGGVGAWVQLLGLAGRGWGRGGGLGVGVGVWVAWWA